MSSFTSPPRPLARRRLALIPPLLASLLLLATMAVLPRPAAGEPAADGTVAGALAPQPQHPIFVPTGQAEDRFGRALALDGALLVVGAGNVQISGKPEQGAAYLFARDRGGADNWGQVATLTAADGQTGDLFGGAVHLHRDLVAVGAAERNQGRGAVYLFARNQGGADNWGQIALLTAADALPGDNFGAAVAVHHAWIAVGAPRVDVNGQANQGAVYLFARNQGGADNWGQVAKVVAQDGAALDQLGGAVALSAGTLLAGADQADLLHDSLLQLNQGAAYLFARNQGGADNWGQVAKLTTAEAAPGARFGAAVALDGETVAVGAYEEGSAQEGAVHLFRRNRAEGDGWGRLAVLTAPAPAAADRFGRAVALHGDLLAVGAVGVDVSLPGGGTAWDQGAVFLYSRHAGAWQLLARLTPPTEQTALDYGRAVALSGDGVAMGADQLDLLGNENQGSAYVTRLAGDCWLTGAALQPPTAPAGAAWGSPLSLHRDLAVAGAPDQEAALLWAREDDGVWRLAHSLTPDGLAAGGRFGRAVAAGVDLVAVGAPESTVAGRESQGAVQLFARERSGAGTWVRVATLTAADGAAFDNFGSAVALSADAVLVGAPRADVGSNGNQGAAYLFARNQGGADNWGQVAKLTASDGRAADLFGGAVALDGDTALVGAHLADILFQPDQGAAYLFARNQGGADRWRQVAKLVRGDGISGDGFGRAVAVAGDLALVGAPSAGEDGIRPGQALIFARNLGGADQWDEAARLTLSAPTSQESMGHAVGLSPWRAATGAPDFAAELVAQGAVRVFDRSPADAWELMERIPLPGNQNGDQAGAALALDLDWLAVGLPGAEGPAGQDIGRVLLLRRAACPALNLAKQADVDTPLPGDAVSFRFAVANRGLGPATDVTLSDTLPAGLVAAGPPSLMPPLEARIQSSGPVWVSGLTLLPDQAVSFTLPVQVADATDGRTIINTASLTSVESALRGERLASQAVLRVQERPATLTVAVAVAGRPPATDWRVTNSATAPFTLPATGGQSTFTLPAGAVTVTVGSQAGYDAAFQCSNGTTGGLSVALAPGYGEHVTCTVRQTARPAALTVTHVVVGWAPAAGWSFDGPGVSADAALSVTTSFTTSATGGVQHFPALPAGLYTVTRQARAGYDLASGCDGPATTVTGGFGLDLAPGIARSCILTSTAQPASLTVRTVVSGAPPAAPWRLSGPTGSFTVPAAGGVVTLEPLVAGSTALSITGRPDFAAATTCDTGSPTENGAPVAGETQVALTLLPGAEGTCTVTLRRLAVAIAVTRTVGLEPDFCPPHREATVPAGSTVYFCDTVENRGAITLPLQSVVDSVAGPVITAAPVALAPGARLSSVELGLVMSRTITRTMDAPLRQVVGWHAFVNAEIGATAVATATVRTATASIQVTKTVGFTGAGCPGSRTLVAPRNALVDYCVTIRNSGAVTLTRHRLVDPMLSMDAVLDMVLAPGATLVVAPGTDAQVAALGGQVVTEGLTNTVEVISSNPALARQRHVIEGAFTARSTAQATVRILAPASPPPLYLPWAVR